MNTAQSLTSFVEVNKYLSQFHDQAHTKYNLDKMRQLVEYLGNPQDKFKAVHIAGTSGKTSTSYYMSALLSASGHKTGLTISPHVDELNERVQINNHTLSEADFCQSISEYLTIIEKAPLRPSWFELMVGFAYWYFAKEKVDYAVIEVGLGGLLDGTNVMGRRDKVCIITDIGYDHVNVLGRTLEEIAGQKAGIIKSGNAVFTYTQPKGVLTVIKEVANSKNGSLSILEPLENPDQTMPDYQFKNWALANAVYDYLVVRDDLPKLDEEALEASRHILIPGRMDISHVNGKLLIMDGAHNVQKMEAFVKSFTKLYPGVRPAVLLGMRSGKEYQAIVPLLSRFASRIITTEFKSSQDLPINSLAANTLATDFNSLPANSQPDQRAAFKELLAGPEEICVITGSFYLLGQIRSGEHLV